ncbi:MAG: adenylate/guanylate cyclase domain-containing protein [Bacteroidota bacterium]
MNYCYGQEVDIAKKEDLYKESFGTEKLEILNELTHHYRKVNSRKSIKYGKLAIQLGEEIFSKSNAQVSEKDGQQLALAYLQLGIVMLDKERFYDAKTNLEQAFKLAELIEEEPIGNRSKFLLDSLSREMDTTRLKQGLLSKTIGNLKIGEVFNNTTNDLRVQAEIKLGNTQERKGNLLKAIGHYERAIDLLKNRGDSENITQLQLRIAKIYNSLQQHTKAQEYLGGIIASNEESLTTGDNEKPTNKDLKWTKESQNDELRVKQRELKSLAERFAAKADYETSIAYYKRYQELTLRIKQDSLNQVVQNRERQNEIALLKQQKEIADMNVFAAEREKQQETKIKNFIILAGLVLLLGAIGLFYLYLSKRKQHTKLTITYRDLNSTKSKLENAEKRIVKLLTQQVSADVAQELLSDSPDEPGRQFVCIMFLDIRDFTPMAEKMSPEQLIEYQNNVFGFMINTVQKHNGNVNQLLGDGFMATFGAPISHGNDCQNALNAAIEIIRELKERNNSGLIQKTKIGIGLHAGEVVTGNVGNESRKQYSVTGNAVIVASRVEQLNKEYKSQLIITEAVQQYLHVPLEDHPVVKEIKLKGRQEPIKIFKIV